MRAQPEFVRTELTRVQTTAQLRAAGLSSRQIRRLVRQGALRPLLTGVYASQANPGTEPAPHARPALVGARVVSAEPPDRAAGSGDRKARQADGELLRVAAALAVTGSRSTATGSRTASSRSTATGFRPAATGFRPAATGFRPAATGSRSAATGSRPAATGSRSVGSHGSAARVYGLGVVGPGPTPLIEITRAPGDLGGRTGGPGVLVHAAALPADHVVRYHGVLLTSVPRTVIDLARALPFAEGVAVADSALHAGLTSKSALSAVIADCPRWPGVQRARAVTAFSDARAESVLESLSRAVFHQAGLPPPDLQVWVGDDEEVIARVDFLWRRYRTIGEADGALKYQNPARARAQLERDARLRAASYEVVHFTWPEITRAPGQVIDAIQVAFSRGGHPAGP